MNDAISSLAWGFRDGGVGNVTNYPGFFSQDVFFALGGKKISINERVAFEMAYGSSLAGRRSVVTMKNIGLNVAADSFLHAIISGVRAGLVVVVTEDTEMTASQEKQDSRSYYDFFGGLWLEPNSLQSAYEIARDSFRLSEEYDIPVVIRLTSEFFKLKGGITRSSKNKKNLLPSYDPEKFIIYPNYWKKQADNLKIKNARIKKFVETCHYNMRTPTHSDQGIVINGCAKGSRIRNDWERFLVQTYPIPERSIKKFLGNKKKVKIIEQGGDLVKRSIEGLLAKRKKNLFLPRSEQAKDSPLHWMTWNDFEKLFRAIRSSKPSFLVGDVGQYTVETTHTINSALCLGSSVGVCLGLWAGGVDYPLCVTGDAAFLHGGLVSLIEAKARGATMGIVIIDNGVARATGGQEVITDVRTLLRGVDRFEIDYDRVTEKEIRSIMIKMQHSRKLSVLIVKCK